MTYYIINANILKLNTLCKYSMLESIPQSATNAISPKFPSAPISISDIYFTLFAELNNVSLPEVRDSLIRLGEFEGWITQITSNYKNRVATLQDWVSGAGQQPMTLEKVYATLSQHTEHLSDTWLQAMERLREFSLGTKSYTH